MLERGGDDAPTRLFVDFTDGRKVLRAVVQASDVMETEGQEINDALERAAVLSTIDAKWTEHLRDLDEVKEGVGLRAYGQKDPLIEYKMEAYRLFKEMIQTIDEEVVSLVFKAGPLVQGDSRGTAARRVQEVSKPRMDASRAQAQHEAGDPNYAATFGAKGGNGQSAAEKDPTATAEPIVAGDRVGRNDPCPTATAAPSAPRHPRSLRAGGRVPPARRAFGAPRSGRRARPPARGVLSVHGAAGCASRGRRLDIGARGGLLSGIAPAMIHLAPNANRNPLSGRRRDCVWVRV